MDVLIHILRSEILWSILSWIYTLTPLWLPIVLLIIFFKKWIALIQTQFIEKEGSVLLEIKLPQEITKSPAAMELVLLSMHQLAKNNLIDAYITGKTRPWFSLELVSIGGSVKFFIWARKRFRKMVETQIYAQYPTVEVHEAQDYAMEVHHPGKLTRKDLMPFWAGHFVLTKDDVYPIKTYIDYGLDKDPKEEYKIDPMTPMLEYLGSLKPGEQAWVQILIRAHRKEGFTDIRLSKKPDWTDAGKKEIKEKMEKLKEEGENGSRTRQPTKVEADVITALERSLTKAPFEVGIRGFYIAPPDVFNPANIPGIIGSFKQYGSEHLNGFKPSKATTFDFPWQDFGRRKQTKNEKKMLEAYKRRSFFEIPFKFYRVDPFILNVEELATIFHFPGRVATTPTIQKTTSTKGQPPPNLPV